MYISEFQLLLDKHAITLLHKILSIYITTKINEKQNRKEICFNV